jgi:hypothetical protein
MKTYLKIALAVFMFAWTGCLNLKQLNDYSSTASEALKKFESIHYSFSRHCQETNQFKAVKEFRILKDSTFDCRVFEQADQVTQIIYIAIKGYFDGLTMLSDKQLTAYNTDGLNKALTEGKFGKIEFKKADVEAYSTISTLMLRAGTDPYRKKKLKTYIGQANAPIQVLLGKLDTILSVVLKKELKWKKDERYRYYQRFMEGPMPDHEKAKATMEYYQQLSEIALQEKQLEVFGSSLRQMAKGHQELYTRRNDLSAKDLKMNLTYYAGVIENITSEFEKLKK